jgi:excisionase family DNA binding protein
MQSDARLTVAEAAQRLKLARGTVYQWIHEGKLPAIRLGTRAIRVRESDLARAEQMVTPHLAA